MFYRDDLECKEPANPHQNALDENDLYHVLVPDGTIREP